jgi:hypothetical protein
MPTGISTSDQIVNRPSSRLDTPISNASSVAEGRTSTRGLISPPPLRLSQTRGDTPPSATLQTLPNDSTTVPASRSTTSVPQLATPPSKASESGQGSPQWSAPNVAAALEEFYLEVKTNHAQMVAHGLESTKTREWRTTHGRDIFASLGNDAVAAKRDETMQVKFKASNSPQTKAHLLTRRV